MALKSTFNSEEFHQLILNASSYMTKIDNYSFKIVNSSIQSILSCLNAASQLLKDTSSPTIKKLFVLRFVKDTMILASLSFYLCVLIKIGPWIISASKICEINTLQKRLEMMGKLLRGNNELMNSDTTICKTILQLIDQMIKWFGINMKDHPYSKLQFRSFFKLLLEKIPRIQSIRVTDLTFFKNDDPNKYQAYYIERDSGQAEGERIGQYISQAVSRVQQGGQAEQINLLIETGDQFVIAVLIQQLERILQDANPNNVLNKVDLVEYVHQIVGVGDVEMVNLVKDYLLEKIAFIVLILHRHKTQIKQASTCITTILSIIKSWNSKCQSLFLPVQTFRELFRLFERQGISCGNINELNLEYKAKIGFNNQINKDKLDQIDCNQSQSIKRIRSCRYIPVYQSIPYKKQKQDQLFHSQSLQQQFLSSNKSNSRQSNNSLNKRQFLQAFSKFPQQANNIRSNTSQVNSLQIQQSNISDHQPQPLNTPQIGEKPLIMSFKKADQQKPNNSPYSPQVVFTDSFTSNQKNSPMKIVNMGDYVDMVNEPSVQVNSQSSNKFKSSNKQSNNNIIFSHPPSYSNKHPSLKNSGSKASNQLYHEQMSNYYNDYMIPKSDQSEPVKSSKAISKIKKQKSSSLLRQKQSMALKSSSRQKKGFSPTSRLSYEKSINLLQFNQGQATIQQQYKPENHHSKMLPPVEQIKVEKTIQKPKFGFKEEEQSSISEHETIVTHKQLQNFTISKSESYLSSIHSQSLGSVPDNFMDLLKKKPEKVKVNAFEDKVKELEKQIQKMRNKKQQVVNQVRLKQENIKKLKSQMPLAKPQLLQQNLKLKRAIMQPKLSDKVEIEYRKSSAYTIKGTMKHISVTPLRQQVKKQLVYSKCRLYKGEYLQIGFQVKNKDLSIYLTFLQPIQQCTVKVQPNSLQLAEQIDAKIYKLPEGKQIKFKSAIQGYQLFSGQFQMALLVVKAHSSRKQIQNIQLPLPYHLYNIIKFNPPRATTFNKITDWHNCCISLLSNTHYITDYFPHAKTDGSIFSFRGQIQQQGAQVRVIIDNNKFAIQFEGINQQFEQNIVRCVMALLQANK